MGNCVLGEFSEEHFQHGEDQDPDCAVGYFRSKSE